MHLHGSLTVANVANLLPGDSVDIFEDSREVVIGHVLVGEFPKLLIFIRIVSGVVAGVFIATTIAQPHVVSLVREHEGGSLTLIVDQPSV